jgi:beta-glucanase (GH16 family)
MASPSRNAILTVFDTLHPPSFVAALRNILLVTAASIGVASCGGVNGDLPGGEFVPATVEWQLVFSDEFDGTELDEAKWNIREGDGCPDLCGWGNNELQVYSADNIEVSNGTLKLRGEDLGGGNYTSARIDTAGKFDFTYGKVEVRARIPSGAGTWPAIWALHSPVGAAPGADFPDLGAFGPWPLSGEIDIMEGFSYDAVTNDKTKSTTHYGLPIEPFDGSGGFAEKNGMSLTSNADMQFYVYGMEWERGRIRFFVDQDSLLDRNGQLTSTGHFQTQTVDEYYVYFPANSEGYYNPLGAFRGSLENEPFDQAFHLLLNFAIGGNPVGNPGPGTMFPQDFEIDYVRVYECANSNPDSRRGCGAVDSTVVPLKDHAGSPLENANTANPYIESLDLYLDAPEVISVPVGTETATNALQVDGFTGPGATVISDIAAVDPEDPENTVWRVAISGDVANVFLASEDKSMDPVLDTGFDLSTENVAGGMPAPVGEIVFDMYVNSVTPDANIVIKLDSGFPNAGEFVLPESELVVGAWKTYSVKFDELLANPGFVDCCGGQGVDLERVVNPFVFEVTTGDVDVLLDNISVTNACYVVGACSARPITRGIPDFVVFDDAVNNQVWDRGIFASDSGSGFVDYNVPNDPNNKVNWQIIDDVDPDRGQVIEVTLNDSAESGVWFIASSAGVNLEAFSAGAVVFDIIVDDYGDNTSGMAMKIDCFFPCTSGDKILGVIADGVWETVTVPVASLTSTGLDLTNINTGIVVNPVFGDQAGGITFRVDNIRWIAETDAPPPAQIDLPVTFDDAGVDYSLIDFAGTGTSLIADPDDMDNTVASTTKGPGAETFAGTVIGTDAGFANPIPFAAGDTSMSVRVRSPAAGIPILLRVENIDNTAGAEVLMNTTVADQWETITWDFSTVGIDLNATYVKAIIFFDFGQVGVDTTFLWDDVTFGDGSGPVLQPVNLPVTFDEANVNYSFIDFGGTATTVGMDPDNMGNNVGITVKGPPETFAGTVVGDGTGFAMPIPIAAGDATMSLRVRSPAAGIPVMLKIETADQLTFAEVTVNTTVADQWETLTFDFTTVGIDPAFTYVQAVVFFDFNTAGAGETYYWDDLEFVPAPATQPFPVFDNAVDPTWDVGIAGTESPNFPLITDGAGAITRWVVADGTTLVPADDPARGNVIEATVGGTAPEFGLLFIQSSTPVDLSTYAAGSVVFDIFVVDYGTNTNGMMMKIDCVFPCTSGDQSIGVVGDGQWETVSIPVSQLVTAGLNLATVNTGIAVYPDIADQQAGADVVFRIDNVRWEP